MSKLRHILLTAAGMAPWAAAPACDPCEPEPDGPGNQHAASLEPCPALPDGIAPIEGLAVAHAYERFDGLVLTLSSRTLACGDPAAQHDYCDDGEGVTVGLPAEESTPGLHALGHGVHVEFETPNTLTVGGSFEGAAVELFEITDSCVTGRIVGLTSHGGPFDGGFQAPRCTP
ncbi:MAG: hypothetical protein KDK70_38590 [Myxococcales bacterium]|nr:hypothetical protein [Myxococcales bacterium]